jgi:hypothetical protein
LKKALLYRAVLDKLKMGVCGAPCDTLRVQSVKKTKSVEGGAYVYMPVSIGRKAFSAGCKFIRVEGVHVQASLMLGDNLPHRTVPFLFNTCVTLVHKTAAEVTRVACHGKIEFANSTGSATGKCKLGLGVGNGSNVVVINPAPVVRGPPFKAAPVVTHKE